MKFMGSKDRFMRYIRPIIEAARGNPKRLLVEPFVGGANSFQYWDNPRLGCDINPYLIEMWLRSQQGWEPPKFIGEGMYADIKNLKDYYDPELVAYVGFAMSFGGKWYGGYRRDKRGQKGDPENMRLQSIRSYRSFVAQAEKLAGAQFRHCSYEDLILDEPAVIYCDPPYKGTTGYVGDSGFDHAGFWKWCDERVSAGHIVFVSEYQAPAGWECVWEKPTKVGLDTATVKRAVEKLFVKVTK